MRPQLADVLTTLLLLIPAPVVKAATYGAIKQYSGPTFFDDWEFYDHYDNLMNGDVNFVSAVDGVASKLAYVDSDTKHAIIKIDNATIVPDQEKRKGVRITSKDSYDIGSLWVADIHHAPYGCSVWPAWWSFAQKAQWPQGGEIDTFEGVNHSENLHGESR